MIRAPYSFKLGEKKIISSYFTDYNDWDKIIFNNIKNNIRVHLRLQQSNKCCYCQRQLGFDIKDVDIEHIIPKSFISKFTFHKKNLALSCPGCNTKKHDKDIFKTARSITNYPSNSNNIKIIHAHYDEYSKHIEILPGSVYVAITSKGSETITICELFRLKEVQKRANAFNSKTSLAAELVENLRQGGSDAIQLLGLIAAEVAKLTNGKA